MVDVEFGLGQSGDEGVQVVVVGQGFLPGNGARPCVRRTRVIG